MSTEGVMIGSIVGVVAGVVSAVVINKALSDQKEEAHQAEIAEVVHTAYQDGWRDASNHAGNIRKRYREMFEETNVDEGTTQRHSRKG